MTDPVLKGLLSTVADGDLNALLMLTDYLEEIGHPEADRVRRLYQGLHDDFVYAPLSFRYFGVAREQVLPLFPEYEEGSG
jgi:hypothetical protein